MWNSRVGTRWNAPLVLNTAIGVEFDSLMYETIRVYSERIQCCVLVNLFAVIFLVIMSGKCLLCAI